MPDRPGANRTQSILAELDVPTAMAKIDKELNEITAGIKKIYKDVDKLRQDGADPNKFPTVPPPAVLNEYAYTKPDDWEHESAANLSPVPGPAYWLQKNAPAKKAGSQTVNGDIIIRADHGGPSRYTSYLLEQSIRIYMILEVTKKIDGAYDTTNKKYPVLSQDVSGVDASLGYSDFKVAHPDIDVTDHVQVLVVMTCGMAGMGQVEYSMTRDFTAGGGIPAPETLTVLKARLNDYVTAATRLKLKLQFAAPFVTSFDPTTLAGGCCNFYEYIEVYAAFADGHGDDGDEDWDGLSSSPVDGSPAGWAPYGEDKDITAHIRRIEREEAVPGDRYFKVKIKPQLDDDDTILSIQFDKTLAGTLTFTTSTDMAWNARIVDKFGQTGDWIAEPP